MLALLARLFCCLGACKGSQHVCHVPHVRNCSKPSPESLRTLPALQTSEMLLCHLLLLRRCSVCDPGTHGPQIASQPREANKPKNAFPAGAGPHVRPASVFMAPKKLSSISCALQTQGPKLGVIQCMLLNEGELGEGD